MQNELTTDPQDVSSVTPENPTLPQFYQLAQLMDLPTDFKKNDVLLGDDFLCAGGSAAILAPTHVGKSSLALQFALRWGAGLPCFGITPKRVIRSLMVQSENDHRDIRRAADGIMAGAGFETRWEKKCALQKVTIGRCAGLTGESFMDHLCKLYDKFNPDLVWLDPLLGFMEGGATNQEAVSQFLRQHLQEFLLERDAAAFLVHHTNKPPRDGKESRWTNAEQVYSGAGTADIANWLRAALVIEPTKAPGVFKLICAKRAARIGWTTSDGKPTDFKFIAHSTDGSICWHEAEAVKVAQMSKRSKSVDDLIAHVPADGAIPKTTFLNNLNQLAGNARLGQKQARALLDDALSSGRLFEWKQKRTGTNPLLLVSRKPQSPEAEVVTE